MKWLTLIPRNLKQCTFGDYVNESSSGCVKRIDVSDNVMIHWMVMLCQRIGGILNGRVNDDSNLCEYKKENLSLDEETNVGTL